MVKMNTLRSNQPIAFFQNQSTLRSFHQHSSMILSVLLVLCLFSSLLLPVVISKGNSISSENSFSNPSTDQSNNDDRSPSVIPSEKDSETTSDTSSSSNDQSSSTQTSTQSGSTIGSDDDSSDSSSQNNPTTINQQTSTPSTQTETENAVSPSTSPTSSPEEIEPSTSNQGSSTENQKSISSNNVFQSTELTNNSDSTISALPNLSKPKGLLNNSSHSGISNSENNQYQSPTSNSFVFQEGNASDPSSENAKKQYVSNIGTITKDQHVKVTLIKEEKDQANQNQKTTIEKVEFTAASTQKNVQLSVKNLREKPVEVKTNITRSNTSEIYEYLDIKLISNQTYIGETGIQKMNFTFTVNTSWIQTNNIDKHTVVLMRYHNNRWQSLNTSYVNETNGTVRFIADTPGLSIFAVVGDKVVEDSDDIVVESTHFPWWMPVSVIFISTISLGVVLVKKRFVYKP